MESMFRNARERTFNTMGIDLREPKELSPVDQELEELLSKQRAKIKVIGAGGAGNNTINRLFEVGVKGAETIAVNTDAQDLLYTNSDAKILIGKEITHGLGAGSIPQVGEEAAKESEHEIKEKRFMFVM